MASILAARQTNPDQEFVFDERERSFWWTRTGQIVRWSIFLGLFGLLLAYMIIGYWHAKRRLSKGLKPLAYHRWLLNRQQRAIHEPEFQNPQIYYTNYQRGPQYQLYNMQPMPPPMYDPNTAMPPVYSPPVGATKVDPSQWRTEPTRRPQETGEAAPNYDAPAGPPPAAALRPDNTGTSNNPYGPR